MRIDLQIRLADVTDFDALLAIDQQCFPPEIAYDAGELRYYTLQRYASTLVAELNGRLAGFLIMTRGRRSATLVTLDIVKACRRRGVGRALLERSEEILRSAGIGRYELQVDTTNAGAIEFYRLAGFTVRHTIREYYGEGLDAYLMEKRLTGPVESTR